MLHALQLEEVHVGREGVQEVEDVVAAVVANDSGVDRHHVAVNFGHGTAGGGRHKVLVHLKGAGAGGWCRSWSRSTLKMPRSRSILSARFFLSSFLGVCSSSFHLAGDVLIVAELAG